MKPKVRPNPGRPLSKSERHTLDMIETYRRRHCQWPTVVEAFHACYADLGTLDSWPRFLAELRVLDSLGYLRLPYYMTGEITLIERPKAPKKKGVKA